MFILFPHLWEKIFGKSKQSVPMRPRRMKPCLEILEDRTVPSTFDWTGAASTHDNKWSTPANWLVNGSIATQAPGPNDAVVFDPLFVTNANNGPSIVDAGFGGTVQKLTILAAFPNTYTVTLNTVLTVTTEADISGGMVAGTANLDIGDHPTTGQPQDTAVLNWTGGTLTGPTSSYVDVNSLSTVNISGPALKTLDERNFYNSGTVNWTGGGNILLKDSSRFADAGTMNAALTSDAVIDGNGETGTGFQVLKGGVLNVNPQQTGPFGSLEVTATLRNDGTVNLDKANLLAQYNTITTGQYTIADGSELDFNGANTITLDGSAGTCVLTGSGSGEAYFGAGSHVIIIGTVNVGNVDDNSNLLDDTANSTLIVNGKYIWRGSGKWAGAGATQIGTNTNRAAQLILSGTGGASYDLERKVMDFGTITWQAADISLTVNGSIELATGSTFDIQTDNTISGTGTFKNGGTLQKSQGSGHTIFDIPYSEPGGGYVKTAGGTGFIDFNHYVQVLNNVEVAPGSGVAYNGGMEQDGGAVTDSGTITVAGDYAENAGTFTLNAGQVVAANINVVAGAVFSGDGAVNANVNNAGEVDTDASGHPLAVVGAYTQTAGVTNVVAGSDLTVTGLLDEQYGVVNLFDGGLEADGGFQVDGGYQWDGVYDGAVLTGDGPITANVTNAGQVDATGTSPLAVVGDYTQTTGVTNIAAGAGLTVTGLLDEQGGVVNLLDGSLQADGGYQIASESSLSGDGQITANVTNAGEVNANGTGPLAVSGAYTQIAASPFGMPTTGATTVAAGSALSVSGLLDEQAGVLYLLNSNLEADGGYQIAAGASLSGSGTITADVTNGGMIQLGALNNIGGLAIAANPSAGVAGNFTQSGGGVLDVAIAGASSYDAVSVAGQATLGGTLNVQVLDGFMPSGGQWFDLVSGLSSGQFAVLNLPTFAGVTLEPEYNAVGHAGFSLWAADTTYTSMTSSSGYGSPTLAPGQVVTFTATVGGYRGATPTPGPSDRLWPSPWARAGPTALIDTRPGGDK